MIFGTVVTKNYLAHARTLAYSLVEHNPNARLYVLLADQVDGYIQKDNEPFTLIQLEQLDDSQAIERMCFYYTPFELANGLKGQLHQYLKTYTEADQWIYLDSDILVLDSFEPILNQLSETSLLLSKHFDNPLETSLVYPHEIKLLRYGLFNGGFLGIRQTPLAEQFIDWFSHRLQYYSLFDLDKSLFVDQLWLNLIPVFFPDTDFWMFD